MPHLVAWTIIAVLIPDGQGAEPGLQGGDQIVTELLILESEARKGSGTRVDSVRTGRISMAQVRASLAAFFFIPSEVVDRDGMEQVSHGQDPHNRAGLGHRQVPGLVLLHEIGGLRHRPSLVDADHRAAHD